MSWWNVFPTFLNVSLSPSWRIHQYFQHFGNCQCLHPQRLINIPISLETVAVFMEAVTFSEVLEIYSVLLQLHRIY
jgi:hypothetical protein